MNPEEYIELQERFLEIRELDVESQAARINELPPQLAEPLKELLGADDDDTDFLEQPIAPDRSAWRNFEFDATETFAHEQAEKQPSYVGPYQILQQIGEGGHGIVYMAEQKAPIRRRVALKLIKPGMESKEILARFEAERQALAMMKHPSIANVLDAGSSESGSPYFVMELVHGLPIDEFCRRNQLSLAETLELFQQVCEAVHHAHRKGIIHRDLKPANILVTIDSGRPLAKVIDFGIAKALHLSLTDRTMFTEYGQIVGTLEYMSPEQATMSQDLPDVRSDVYSLGVVLYVLLTGLPPISKQQLLRKGIFELGHVIEEYRPQTPSLRLTDGNKAHDWRDFGEADRRDWQRRLRGDLDWITMKALSKDPKLRYDGAAELRQDITNYLAGLAVVARPPSWSYEFSKWIRRHKLASAFALTLVTCLLISLGAITWAYVKTNESLGTVQAAKELVSTKAKELQKSLAETSQERARADTNAERLADRLQQEILKSAWTQALDGNAQEAQYQLQSIPPSKRQFVWHFVDKARQQISNPALRTESSGPVRCSALHDNTGMLGLITTDSRLELWNLETRRMEHEILLEPRIYSCLTFSEDGQRVLLGAPGMVALVDIKSKSRVRALSHLRGGTRDIAYFSQRHQWLVTTGSNHLLALDATRLEVTGERQLRERLEKISIHPQGTHLAVATVDGAAILLNPAILLEPAVVLNPSETNEPATVKASNSALQDFFWTDNFLFACDLRGQFFRIDYSASPLATKFENLSSTLPSSHSLSSLCFLDQQQIAVAQRTGNVDLKALDLEALDLKAQDQTIPLRTYQQSIRELHARRSSGSFVVRHSSGRINTISGEIVGRNTAQFAHTRDLTDGLSLANRPLSFTAHEDGIVRRWNRTLGTLEKESQIHQSAILAMDAHEESNRIATYGLDMKIQVSPIDDMGSSWTRETFLGIRSLRFSHSGQLLAAAPKREDAANPSEGTIDLWDAEQGTTIGRLSGHQNWVMQLAFERDDAILYSLSLDGTLKKWDVSSARELLSIDLTSESPVRSFALNEKTILLGHEDGSLSVRSTESGERIRHAFSLANPIQEIVLPWNSNVAFITSEDSAAITCVAPQSLEVIAELDAGVGTIKGMRADRNFKQVQILGTNGLSRTWPLPAAEVLTSSD